jgi:hypothetical protein
MVYTVLMLTCDNGVAGFAISCMRLFTKRGVAMCKVVCLPRPNELYKLFIVLVSLMAELLGASVIVK